jgi:hypothetical protein
MNKTTNTTNRIHAMLVAVPAIPVKPNRAAINAIIRNVTAQFNMVGSPLMVPFIVVLVLTIKRLNDKNMTIAG